VVVDTQDSFQRLAIQGKVQVTPPVAPPTATPVTIDASIPLDVGSHDTTYTITSGKTFVIQQIVAGAEGDPTEKGSKIEVYFDDGTERLIERIYITGFTQYGVYPDTQTSRDGTILAGNGSNELVVRRQKLGGSNKEIDVVIRGYEI
jgi:hypothetical protein